MSTTILRVVILSVSIILIFYIWGLTWRRRQKTRESQPRRMYTERGPRGSSPQPPPSVFVTPHNIQPPPKYEMMAPPSYEEVVGVHYPNYLPANGNQVVQPDQPITQPLTISVAQMTDNCRNGTTSNSAEANETPVPTTSNAPEQTRITIVASS